MLGLKILRVNHKHNIIYVVGGNLPGEPGEFVKIYDSKIKHKSFQSSPKYFPTCYPEQYDTIVGEEYSSDVHKFNDPPISYK